MRAGAIDNQTPPIPNSNQYATLFFDTFSIRQVVTGSNATIGAATHQEMVKASASSQILQGKFKPWRRGKSAKGKHAGHAKPTASLKQQLRGLLRLQTKLVSSQQQQPPGQEHTTSSSLSEENEARIIALRQQIAARESSAKERSNATKSHKARFYDRQKSMRRYKKLMHHSKKKDVDVDDDAKDRQENELYKLALDQIYIAHYPLGDATYLSLYQQNGGGQGRPDDNNEDDDDPKKKKNISSSTFQRRTILNARLLFKMAAMRHRALETCRCRHSNNNAEDDPTTQPPSRSWVPVDQYERINTHAPTRWTTELERTTFGVQLKKEEDGHDDDDDDNDDSTSRPQPLPVLATADHRFHVSNQQAALLAEAAQIEKNLEKSKMTSGDDDDDHDDISSNSSNSENPPAEKRVVEAGSATKTMTTRNKWPVNADEEEEEEASSSTNSTAPSAAPDPAPLSPRRVNDDAAKGASADASHAPSASASSDDDKEDSDDSSSSSSSSSSTSSSSSSSSSSDDDDHNNDGDQKDVCSKTTKGEQQQQPHTTTDTANSSTALLVADGFLTAAVLPTAHVFEPKPKNNEKTTSKTTAAKIILTIPRIDANAGAKEIMPAEPS
jgi:hypothetical protein